MKLTLVFSDGTSHVDRQYVTLKALAKQCDPIGECFSKDFSDVRECDCPPNYRGLHCEDCAPGYHDYPICHRDKEICGGYCHEGFCSSLDKKCVCPAHLAGTHCEMCAPGFTGGKCSERLDAATLAELYGDTTRSSSSSSTSGWVWFCAVLVSLIIIVAVFVQARHHIRKARMSLPNIPLAAPSGARKPRTEQDDEQDYLDDELAERQRLHVARKRFFDS